MTLPRFTSGRVGNLEFQHLNEAFDRIDALGSAPERNNQRSDVFNRTIVARVEAIQGTGLNALAKFSEYAPETPGSSTYIKVTGGVTSTIGTDDYAAPLVYPFPDIGSVIPIVAGISNDGKLYFKSQSDSGSQTRFGMVESRTQLYPNRMWLYTLRFVAFDLQANTWTQLGGTFTALNGCENPVDDVNNRTIGVGTIYPSGATAVRQPIVNGTICACIVTAGHYLFSIPNGYSFTCS